MTDSGYPRIVKEWKRGTPFDHGPGRVRGRGKSNISVGAYHDQHARLRAGLRVPGADLLHEQGVPADQEGSGQKIDKPDDVQMCRSTATG